MQNLLQFIFDIPVAFAQNAASEKNVGESLNILSFLFEKLPLWITAVIVFVVSLVIGAMVKGIVENRLGSKMDEEEHQEVLIISGRVAFLSVAVIGTTIALAIAGIDITALLAAVGFGISFGMQDTISNFVAGIAILASRPFTIGDWIQVSGKTGKVMEIRTRATYLKTFDGHRLIVPNSALYKNQVLSYTSNPMRRLKIPVYCRYGADIQDVIAICLKVTKKNPQVFLQPKPHVVVAELEDSYITLEIRCWVDSKSLWRRTQSSIFIEIQNELEQAGFDAPYAVTSLSLEPDVESAVLKTKVLDSDEFTKLMNIRMEEQEKIEKKKQTLVKETNNQTAEQSKNTGNFSEITLVENPQFAESPVVNNVQTDSSPS